MARPSLYDPDYCERVIEHCRDGSSLTSFAAEIGVCRDTVSEWASAHEEFSVAVKRAKTVCAAWWERQAREGASGKDKDVNPTLCIFGLKNMAPEDWRERKEVQHSGEMTIRKSAADMTDDELAAIATGGA